MSKLVDALDQACPGCPSGDRALAYVWMGDFVRHLVRARLDGREDEVRAAFAIIEDAIEAPRPGWAASETSNLAVVGFLEDLQNGSLHAEGSVPSDFRSYLGPKSRDAWESLNGFWQMVSRDRGKQ